LPKQPLVLIFLAPAIAWIEQTASDRFNRLDRADHPAASQHPSKEGNLFGISLTFGFRALG